MMNSITIYLNNGEIHRNIPNVELKTLGILFHPSDKSTVFWPWSSIREVLIYTPENKRDYIRPLLR